MKVGRWSTTPGSNNSTPPDGWPEGQAASTVNDCAREMMASIRTAFQDLQYIDQDFTPTFVSTTSFSIPGNQTSAVHVGRRLKLFDATTLYGTIATASFTTVTTIHMSLDSGVLSSSLSSFGVSVLSNENHALPRNIGLALNTLSVSAAAVINGATTLGSTLSVSGAAKMNSTLSVSATCAAAVFVAPNTVKAWIRGSMGAGNPIAVDSSYNIATASRSATGILRIVFSSGFADANYAPLITVWGSGPANVKQVSMTASTIKMTIVGSADTVTDGVVFAMCVYR